MCIFFGVIFFKIWIFRLGFGNGCWFIIVCGIFNFVFISCILFLNNICSGFIILRLSILGKLFILWCDLIVIEGLCIEIDLMIFG